MVWYLKVPMVWIFVGITFAFVGLLIIFQVGSI